MNAQEIKRGTEVLQKYAYGYGQLDANGTLDRTKNNGQLSQVESWIGTAQQWTKKFSYDSLGRVAEEKELRGDNSAEVYKNVYNFDRFGNMYRKAANNTAALPYNPIEDSHISKSSNQFTSASVYDDAGNVTQDTKFRNLNYSYDANGRMWKTSNTAQTNFSNAVYDAAGQRVASQIDGVWTFFVHDIFGKMVAEYGGIQSTDDGGIKYVLSDWQGSTRAILNSGGYVQTRLDFSAYGEEINVGTGQRTAPQGFGVTNNLTQKYGLTGRDQATGLDHTWWRKNENRAGRWTSPDPYNGSSSIDNPQSFNRYSYVENQPTNYVDPSGLQLVHFTQTYCIRTEGGTVCREIVVHTMNKGDGGNSGGNTAGGGGNNGDCGQFIKNLVSAAEQANSRVGIAVVFAMKAASLISSVKTIVSGFKDALVTGGQNSDVYRHIYAGAAITLGTGSSNLTEVDNIRQKVENWWDGGVRKAERAAAIAGNAAGASTGDLIASHLVKLADSKQLSAKLNDLLCD